MQMMGLRFAAGHAWLATAFGLGSSRQIRQCMGTGPIKGFWLLP